jgi:light-regulated signal transduction histidine kinase (bacteriophytochrome)
VGILIVLSLAILGPTCAAERIGRKRQEELEELTDDLATSNQQLEQFAFATSHGLREPLRHLVAYSDMLEEALTDEPSDDGARILARIRAAGRRLETLVDYLIMYTSSTRLQPERDEVALDEVLGEVRADLGDAIRAAEAHFEVDALPVVSGDREMLGALLKNLIANALRFRGPRPALIQISAVDEGGHWEVAVHDQGIGIPPNYLEQVFEPFFRLHVATDGGGGGVGLSVCKRIVEAHGGVLSVKSKVGTGTSFSFTLPKREAA